MISIKKLSSADFVEFIQLIDLFSENAGKTRTEISSESYLKEFLSSGSNHVLVAIQNLEVIGGLTAYELKMYKAETAEMFLFEIDVKPAFRLQGIATQLIAELKKICQNKNIAQMFVLTSSGNYAANALYKKTGAVADDTSKMFTYYFC